MVPLYIVDWHNYPALVPHAAQCPWSTPRSCPWRSIGWTYPSRPLITQPKLTVQVSGITGKSKITEYRNSANRHPSANCVKRKTVSLTSAVKVWVANLDQNDANYEHNPTGALWVTWGANQVDQEPFWAKMAPIIRSSGALLLLRVVTLHWSPSQRNQRRANWWRRPAKVSKWSSTMEAIVVG